jgi:hypothetical protein
MATATSLGRLTSAEIEAIEAVFTERIYQARRDARLQLLGELPVPVPTASARRLRTRIASRRLGLDLLDGGE